MENEKRAAALYMEFYKLGSMLELAHAMFLSGMPDSDRIGIQTAVSGCINFMTNAFPSGVDLVLPLRELLYALHDLDDGKNSSFLKPAKKKGGRRIPRSVEGFRALAAALMELQLQSGKTRSDAAEEVARELNSHGYRDGQKEISAKRVEEWRDLVNEGGDSLGAKRFKLVLALANKARPGDLQGAIGCVMDCLPAIARRTTPIDPGYQQESD